MKVALLGDYPLEPGKISGGVQAATSYLVEGFGKLADPDLELHVLAFVPGLDADRVAKRNGASIYFLATPGKGEYMSAFSYERKKLRGYLQQISPHLVHAQGAGKFGYIAMRSGYRFLVTVHGICPLNSRYDCSRTLRERFRSALHSHYYYTSLKRTEWIIAISPYVGEAVRMHTRAELIPIPNAISDSYFDLPDLAEQGRLLFAGHILPGKGVLDLVEALRILRERGLQARVRVAGGWGDPQYGREVRNRVAEYELGDQIDFLGTLDDQRLREEYSRCCALVLPSYQETSPMVVQQAMAAGKLCIATDVGGVRHLLRDGEAGILVQPGKPEELAGAIGKLVRREVDAPGLAASARDIAESFRPSAVARKTCEVYRRLANEGK